MRKLLAILLLVSNVVCAQNIDTTTGSVQTTPNVVDPTKWGNVIYMNATQLGQVEGSGGGPVPAFNTDTNTIRFSYMPYTASQLIAINSVLSGQGISVSGFNYSWKIYNDLQNCCGTRGSLFVNGSLTDKSGKVLESYFYDYSLTNTGPEFLKITGTETFSSPYQLNSLGDISISWTGSDMNLWSGYYGPRVRDTELTLNYTVKQSSTTPTTTSTTTNTTDLALAASQPVIQEPTITQTSTSTSTTSTTSEPSTTNTTQSTAPVATSTSTVTAIAPVVQTVQSSTSVQQTTNQPSAPSLSSVLSTIKNNEKKEQAIVNAAIAGANDVAQSAVQMAEQTAMSVATTSSNMSQQLAAQQVTTSQQTTNQNSSSQGLSLLSNTQQNYTSSINQSIINNTVQQNLSMVNQVTQTVEVSSLAIQPVTTQTTSPTQITMTDLRSAEAENTLFANNFLTNRANPLTQIVENNTKSSGSTTEQQEKTLNKNPQPNELAMGISLDRMMTQPIGYNSYLQLALRDASFYAPKEIYKNQVPVDNKRSMYFLEKGNSDTYNRMVEGQYK